MHEENSSLKFFMACIVDNLREREAKEFGKGLDSKDLYRRFGGRGNLRSICMAIVMRELDSCLILDQEHMVEMGSYVGTVIEMVDLNVRCVVLSVRV